MRLTFDQIKSGFTDVKVNSQGGVKPLQEYQFLPEQPFVRTDSLDRATPSQYYGSPTNTASSRAPMLTAYSVPGSVNILPPQQGRPGPSMELDNVARKSSSTVSPGIDTSTPPAHPIAGIENPFVTLTVVTHEEEITRIERKRKVGLCYFSNFVLIIDFG